MYTLSVFIVDGMSTRKFLKKNPSIGRTIQIRGDQTLKELHQAIFDAFDREDEHLHEFIMLSDRNLFDGARYVLSSVAGLDTGGDKPAGTVEQTSIRSLALKAGDAFAYLFDLGDEWFHQIDVDAIENIKPSGKYPRVTKRIGKSPPQYPDMDEMNDE